MSVNTQQVMIEKLIGISLILVFLGVLFLGLFQMSHGMDMSSEITGCPFMSSGEVVCGMNFADHLEAWKSFSLAAPLVLLLIVLVSFVRTLYISCANLFNQLCGVWEIVSISFHKRSLVYIPVQDHLQEAFSNGILHPKLF